MLATLTSLPIIYNVYHKFYFTLEFVLVSHPKMFSLPFQVRTIIFFIGILSLACGEVCLRPEVSATSYTTQDATVLTSLAFITEFTLKCGNGVKGVPLHAEVNGKTLPGMYSVL